MRSEGLELVTGSMLDDSGNTTLWSLLALPAWKAVVELTKDGLREPVRMKASCVSQNLVKSGCESNPAIATTHTGPAQADCQYHGKDETDHDCFTSLPNTPHCSWSKSRCLVRAVFEKVAGLLREFFRSLLVKPG